MFGTSGVRGRFGSEVTADLALSVGRALVAEGNTRIVVGRDPRASGRPLRDALVAGVTASGGDVVDVGTATTPTIARSVAWREADAGVAITASHNPPSDNGIKLWTPTGQAFDEPARESISRRVREESFPDPDPSSIGTRTAWRGAAERHERAIVDAIRPPETPPTVVVDVGNGAGGITPDALRSLGCHVDTLNADPDGSFPARPSEPTAENCRRLRAQVAATDADLGIAHDGDADRMLAVDEDGSFVSGDDLLALFARWAIDDGEGTTVAVPVDTSLAVERTVEEAGGDVVYTPVGDVYVAERASEPGIVFGGEPSGAWIWPSETLCPDGPFAACLLTARLGDRSLATLCDSIPSYPIRRTSVETENKRSAIEGIGTELQRRYENVATLDGYRVQRGDAWGLVRASGTQPLIRITAEGTDESLCESLFEELSSVVHSQVG